MEHVDISIVCLIIIITRSPTATKKSRALWLKEGEKKKQAFPLVSGFSSLPYFYCKYNKYGEQLGYSRCNPGGCCKFVQRTLYRNKILDT